MNTLIKSKEASSPFIQLAQITTLFWEKMTKKNISMAVKSIKKVRNYGIEVLEGINDFDGYDINHLENIENSINAFYLYNPMIDYVFNSINKLKAETDSSSPIYYDIINFSNEFSEFNDVNHKILSKLREIQNHILTKSCGHLSENSLASVWEEDGDVWDNFYNNSIATS